MGSAASLAKDDKDVYTEEDCKEIFGDRYVAATFAELKAADGTVTQAQLEDVMDAHEESEEAEEAMMAGAEKRNEELKIEEATLGGDDDFTEDIPVATVVSVVTPADVTLFKVGEEESKDNETLHYTYASAGSWASYLVRSNGTVDRQTYGGKTGTLMVPPEGTKYVMTSSGEYATYILRDDGVVLRTRGSGKIHSTITPPKGVKYIQVSSGENASYFLRDDGKIDRTRGGGKIAVTIDPPEGQTYVWASAGVAAAYFVRSDGAVDRSIRKGEISSTIDAPAGGVKYVQVSAKETCTYLVRDDGVLDRTWNGVDMRQINPPPGVKYLSASVSFDIHSSKERQSPLATYLVRDDGAVDRTKSGGMVSETIRSEDGTKFVQATSGQTTSFLVREDGLVWYTKGWGKFYTLTAAETIPKKTAQAKA